MPSASITSSILVFSIAVFWPIAGPRGEGGSPERVTSSAIWYVDADAPGLADGSDWENAFLSPHGALAVAAEGDEIRVAQGTYHPAPPDGNRQISFQLVGGVTLRGGFAGYGETDPDERDVSRFTTILSGDLNSDDAESGWFHVDSETRRDNTVHLLLGEGLGDSTVVDGFTLIGGNAGSGRGTGLEGGAIYLASETLTIRDCIFTRNAASWYGGAIRVINGSHLVLIDCRLIDNVAGHGGGISSYEHFRDPCEVVLDNCELRENRAYEHGGAIEAGWVTNLTLTNCVFTENLSEQGSGGAVVTDKGKLLVTGCVFDNNEAGVGGAMYAADPVGGTTVFLNCRFTNNRATARVGGLRISAWSQSTARITNCTFSRNQARLFTGAGLTVTGGPFIISNSIFYGNTLEGAETEDAQIGVEVSAEMQINYSTVEGWTGRFEGWGSADLDPQFVDAEGGDFRLSPGSPVIDAGDNSAVPIGVETDVAGNPRFVDDPMTEDTGVQNCPSVDLGAYEFQAEGGCCARRPRWVCDADVDGDGQVNPVDSGLVQAAFGGTDEQDLCNYDLDCDGRINPVDAGIVQSLFGTCEAPRASCP